MIYFLSKGKQCQRRVLCDKGTFGAQSRGWQLAQTSPGKALLFRRLGTTLVSITPCPQTPRQTLNQVHGQNQSWSQEGQVLRLDCKLMDGQIRRGT